MRTRCTPSSSSGTSTRPRIPGGATRNRVTAPADERLAEVELDAPAERRVDREQVQVDPGHRAHELGIVAAAEPGGDLDHARPLRPEAKLGVRGAVRDPEGGRRRGRGVRHLHVEARRARPDMRERDTEGGRLGHDAVGRDECRERAVDREADHGHLGAVDELLDEREAAAGGAARRLDRGGQARRVANERQALLSLAIRRLDHHGACHLRQVVAAADDPRPGLRHARLGQPLALAKLVRHQNGGGGVDRARQAGPLGNAGGDAHRPVRARGDDPFDPERADEPLDRGLVLGREDAAAVGEPEARSGRVAVDDAEPDARLAGAFEQAELRRAGS